MKPEEPTPTNKDIDQVLKVITALVEHVVATPDNVSVTNVHAGNLVAFVIKCDQDDVRRVIGKQGKHFKALEVIGTEGLRRLGWDAHIAIDEKAPTAQVLAQKAFALGTFNARKFKDVKELLKSVVALFVPDMSGVKITTIDVATMMICEIKIPAKDYPSLYGNPAQFVYGPDGHIIGAIKNFFDGIAKNHGRVFKITVTKT